MKDSHVRNANVGNLQANCASICALTPIALANLILPPVVLTLQTNAPFITPDGSLTARQLLSKYVVVDNFTNVPTDPSPTLSLPTGVELAAEILLLTGAAPAVGDLFYLKISTLYTGNFPLRYVQWPALPVGITFVAVGLVTQLPALDLSLYGQTMTLCFQCIGLNQFSITVVELMQDNLGD